jgi:hypothetical protein
LLKKYPSGGAAPMVFSGEGVTVSRAPLMDLYYVIWRRIGIVFPVGRTRLVNCLAALVGGISKEIEMVVQVSLEE